MNIQWDQAKRLANLLKHGVDLSDAVGVLEDTRAVTVEDTHHEEQRFKTLGIGNYSGTRYCALVAYNHKILCFHRPETHENRVFSN